MRLIPSMTGRTSAAANVMVAGHIAILFRKHVSNQVTARPIQDKY
jgi:hypothetical protein